MQDRHCADFTWSQMYLEAQIIENYLVNNKMNSIRLNLKQRKLIIKYNNFFGENHKLYIVSKNKIHITNDETLLKSEAFLYMRRKLIKVIEPTKKIDETIENFYHRFISMELYSVDEKKFLDATTTDLICAMRATTFAKNQQFCLMFYFKFIADILCSSSMKKDFNHLLNDLWQNKCLETVSLTKYFKRVDLAKKLFQLLSLFCFPKFASIENEDTLVLEKNNNSKKTILFYLLFQASLRMTTESCGLALLFSVWYQYLATESAKNSFLLPKISLQNI